MAMASVAAAGRLSDLTNAGRSNTKAKAPDANPRSNNKLCLRRPLTPGGKIVNSIVTIKPTNSKAIGSES
jgi:hypothetical protein